MQMISIIIPVYNESEILQQSLLKLHQYLSQKNRPFEIITVNNGSGDDTQAKALVMEKKINNYRALDIPEKSVGKAFAKGVREARYDFVISLDADLSVDLAFIDYAEGLLPFADMIVGSKTLGQQPAVFNGHTNFIPYDHHRFFNGCKSLSPPKHFTNFRLHRFMDCLCF